MNENKTNINWYPGHMVKTKRQIIEDLKLIDVVVELLDARIPISSQNPDIEDIIHTKERLIILNKSDLSDEKENKKWVQYFEEKGVPVVTVNANSGQGVNVAIKKIEEIYSDKLDNYINKGRIGKAIRIMILGIPNVGKSSFINRIKKKNVAQVGNKPGVTRQKQWIRVNENIELLDTPGILWPKFDNETIALNLAYTGTIKDDVIEVTEVGFNLLKYLIKYYKDNLVERYKLGTEVKIEDDNALQVMNEIGIKRGAIISGGIVDQERVAKIVLDDFRSGKLGKITLEKVKNK